MTPNWVRAPVATTTASAAPSLTTVPMNRHDDSSASAGADRHRIRRLDGRDRLPRQDRLVALEAARRQEAQVGRDDRSDIQMHDVAGDQVRHFETGRLSPRNTVTMCRMLECSASAARSARYSFTNPNPTDAAMMIPMMIASVPSPTNATRRRPRSAGGAARSAAGG